MVSRSERFCEWWMGGMRDGRENIYHTVILSFARVWACLSADDKLPENKVQPATHWSKP